MCIYNPNMIPNFITWYKNIQNTFNVYNYETKEFRIQNRLEYCINQFELFRGYEANNEGLKKFAEDLIIWRNELLNSKILTKSFDYFDNSYILSNGNVYYRNHFTNIKSFIKRFVLVNFNTFENIEMYEDQYYEKCNNGGLTYHENGDYDMITTYDKKMFYPSMMGSEYLEDS